MIHHVTRKRCSQLRQTFRPWWMKLPVLILGIMASSVLAGLRINVSGSLPIGLYRAVGDGSALKRGSVVIVCLPETWSKLAREHKILGPGRCAGGTYGLGKRAIAVSGDVVTLSPAGFVLNNRILPNSEPHALDRRGRSVPRYPWGTYTLDAGEVWLYSCHPSAFDSRYFGPVQRSSITTVVKPLLVTSDWCSAR